MTCGSYLVICVGVLCSLASTASADPAAAKVHVDAGAKAYATGNYDEAERELQRAYALDPDPALLYARAQALRLGGRCGDAIAIYRDYLATNPNEKQTEAARTGLATCEQLVANAPATPAPEPPFGEPPPVSPEVAPVAQPVQTPPATDTPRWYSDRIAGGLVIGGTAALATGAGFLIASSNSRDDARNAEFRADAIRHLDDATFERRVGVAAIGAGVVLVSAGVYRYLRQRDAPAIAVSVTPREVAVMARF